MFEAPQLNNYIQQQQQQYQHQHQQAALNYSFAFMNGILSVSLSEESNVETFNVELKFKVPNHLKAEEIAYRLCTFKEEQTLMLDTQEIELVTQQMAAESSSRLFNLFKCRVSYDEQFFQLFNNDLDIFVKQQNQLYFDRLAAQSLASESIELESSKIVTYWSTLLNNSHMNRIDKEMEEMNTVKSPMNDINISKLYHALIHSNKMLDVLQRERKYATDLNNLMHERDATLRFVMDEAQLDAETTKWSTRISNLKQRQHRRFYKFLQTLHDKQAQSANGKHNDSYDDEGYDQESDDLDLDELGSFGESNSSPSIKLGNQPMLQLGRTELIFSKSTRLEESYTIQLGAQLKSTHNLRLIRCDIFDFCKERFSTSPSKSAGNDFSLEPQAISTAMSLYSDKLCALILLVENSFSPDNETTTDSANNSTKRNALNWQYLVEICERNGCEFHFPLIEKQKQVAYNYAASVQKKQDLNLGDFYTTKHSNMSQVHAIFHLATNEKPQLSNLNGSFSSSPTSSNRNLKQSDLSSRHPVILGLRNILKACITNSIHTLTLPLLLTHEMNEEMTINWVMKRAELVLKCIKGFMIEFVQWGAQDSRTLQFVVPPGLMDETFNSLSNLIPTIFRESRTVNLV